MVKRCSAKNCYNSQLTQKIAYFGYPKNEETAKEWAIRAGRDDLAEKKIENLTKYYLCSDHFAEDHLINPGVIDKSYLKLKKVNDLFPLPTIFEDNLLKNVETAQQNAEKFTTFSKARRSLEPSMMTERYKRKTGGSHNQYSDGSQRSRKKQILADGTIEEVWTDQHHVVVEEMKPAEEEYVDINTYCRLCAQVCPDLISIFDEHGNFHIETDCFRLMPQDSILKDDGLPQMVCAECLEKLQSCANVIDGFVTNQSYFITE